MQPSAFYLGRFDSRRRIARVVHQRRVHVQPDTCRGAALYMAARVALVCIRVEALVDASDVAWVRARVRVRVRVKVKVRDVAWVRVRARVRVRVKVRVRVRARARTVRVIGSPCFF
mgnify:CR=1 FL=1